MIEETPKRTSGTPALSSFAIRCARSNLVGSVGARRAVIERVMSTTTMTSALSRPLVEAVAETTG